MEIKAEPVKQPSFRGKSISDWYLYMSSSFKLAHPQRWNISTKNLKVMKKTTIQNVDIQEDESHHGAMPPPRQRADSMCSETGDNIGNNHPLIRYKSQSQLFVAERYGNIYSEPLDMSAEYVAPVHPKTAEQSTFIAGILTKNFIFAEVGVEELERVVNAMELFPVEENSVIIKQGDMGDYFYILQKGTVQFLVNNKPVRVGDPGKSFGELALLHDCKRTASCVALEDCELWRLEQKTFRRTIATHRIRKENEIMDLLKSIDIFKELSEAKIRKIYDTLVEKRYKADVVVFEKGSLGETFYIVEKGSVEVKDIGCQRTKILDKELHRGEFFGERSLITGETRSASVVAKTECMLLCMNREDFHKNVGPLEKLIEKSQYKQILMGVPAIVNFNFNSKEIDTVASLLQEHEFEPNHTIYETGQKIKPGLYLIISGKVQCTSAEGHSVTLLKDDYFGDDTFVNKRFVYSTFTVTTVEETKCELLTFNSLQIVFDEVVKSSNADSDEESHLHENLTLDRLEKHAVIGVGTFGQVWLVSDTQNDQTYALKVQSKRLILKYRQQENVIREKNILTKLDHPFIIHMLNRFQDETFLYMVLKLYQGGELFQYIHTRRLDDLESGTFKVTIKFYTACILEGLTHMHQRQIVYRDLKPENVLFDRDGYCVIVDLGFAKVISGKTYTLCGTPAYIAPEVILQRGHDKSADIWSLGIILFELLVGSAPFYTRTNDEIKLFKKICKGSYRFPSPEENSHIDDKGKDLVDKILVLKSNERLGCLAGNEEDLKSHDWFSDLSFAQLAKKAIEAPWIPTIEDPLDCQNFESWEHLQNEYDNEKPPNISKQVFFRNF